MRIRLNLAVVMRMLLGWSRNGKTDGERRCARWVRLEGGECWDWNGDEVRQRRHATIITLNGQCRNGGIGETSEDPTPHVDRVQTEGSGRRSSKSLSFQIALSSTSSIRSPCRFDTCTSCPSSPPSFRIFCSSSRMPSFC